MMNQKQLPGWAREYLHYIQVSVKEPSLEYLTEISSAHLNQIPFENISTLLQLEEYQKKGKLVQDEKRFVRQLFQYHMGGTCYVINSSLHQLLKQLGFQNRYAFLGGRHVALLVQIPGEEEEVYVDAGNGAPFFEPVHLQTDPMNVSRFGNVEIKLRPGNEPGTYRYYRYVNRELSENIVWDFDTKKIYQFDDFQQAIKEYFQPNGLFTSDLRCQIWQLDQRRSLSLVNNVLSIQYSDGEVEKHILADRQSIREVINQEFELPKLPVENAIDVLEELGMDIFKKLKGDL
ncbi:MULTISPECIES: arylamine N-acetyltransferase [Oceanobacillus]|uniref:N-acetyltransferase n=1 Tax=Oceanobacillus oncorhynchi TaxID=545501 RepID=A0A0A1M8V7_9BACI|nr:arylamine N-acetyltransferase [Oceanobacillus oncorhynchi]UUI40331.1 arylamine N-acetyltransferase [Oceanobacillus oncorhynchi]CEI81755.1 N-acetyltransferase [Oceanobacillus oncorhynchi]